MRKQDQLIELIKALTASEKRYFKVFSKTQTSNKTYIALFDELEKQDTYDGKALAKKLKVTPATLADAKEYLQTVLLRSLRLYHEHNSVENTMQVEFMEASLLFKKGLLSYCLSLSNKLMAKAMKYERFTMALNVGRLQALCYSHLRQFDMLKQADERETEILSMLSEYSALIHLRDTLLEPMLTRKGLNEVEDITQNSTFNIPTHKLQSFHARICQGEIGMFYYQYVKPDANKALQYALEQYEEFKRNDFFRSINPSAYYGLLSKLCVRYFGTGQFEQALHYVNQLISETSGKNDGAPTVELKKFNYGGKCIKTTLLSLQGLYAEAAEFARDNYYIKDNLAPNERITFLMDYALSLFHTGQYDECHTQLNVLINDDTPERLDLQLQARLLFIILQIQQKNFSLVPYQTKNLKVWMKKAKANHPGTAELIPWLDKLGKADTKEQMQKTFPLFKSALLTEPLIHISKPLALGKWSI